MNKALMLGSALVLFASPALAQNPSTAPSSGTSARADAPQASAKGVRFRVERPNTSIDISCGDEPAKACIEAAVTLIDKLGSMATR